MRLDVEELSVLLQSAARPRVRELLSNEIQRCERIIADPTDASASQERRTEPRSTEPRPAAAAATGETHVLQSKTIIVPEKYYKNITDYGEKNVARFSWLWSTSLNLRIVLAKFKF